MIAKQGVMVVVTKLRTNREYKLEPASPRIHLFPKDALVISDDRGELVKFEVEAYTIPEKSL